MTHVLDTDHVSILQRGSTPAATNIAARIAAAGTANVGVSIASFHEQFLGAHTYITRAPDAAALAAGYERLRRLIDYYRNFPILDFDLSAAARVRIGAMDLRIAAVALSRGLTVVTRNARDFNRVPGLVLEDWTR